MRQNFETCFRKLGDLKTVKLLLREFFWFKFLPKLGYVEAKFAENLRFSALRESQPIISRI